MPARAHYARGPFEIEEGIDPLIFEALGLRMAAMSYADERLALQIVRFLRPTDIPWTRVQPLAASLDFPVKLTLIRMLAATLPEQQGAVLSKQCEDMLKRHERWIDLAQSVVGPGRAPNEAAFRSLTASPTSGRRAPPRYLKATDLRRDVSKLLGSVLVVELCLSVLGYNWKEPPGEIPGTGQLSFGPVITPTRRARSRRPPPDKHAPALDGN